MNFSAAGGVAGEEKGLLGCLGLFKYFLYLRRRRK
jgi:hypothetical protein